LGFKILSRLIESNKKDALNLFTNKIFVNKLINDPDNQVQVEIFKLLALSEVTFPINLIFNKIYNCNKEIRAAAILNMKNLDIKSIKKILLTIKHLSDDSSIQIQRSFALILQQTIKYEVKKIKKRVITLLNKSCKMSQDPIICKALHEIRRM